MERNRAMGPLKRLHVLAFAVVVLSACAPASSSGPGSVKHVSLSFIYDSSAINALQEMAMGGRAAAGANPGVTYTASAPPGAGFDAPAQVALFQAAMKTSRDGVALATASPDAFVQPLQDARSSSIPVVAVDTPPPPSTGVGAF